MEQPLLKQLIDALQCLPSVGRKSAQRMAYHLLEKNRSGALNLSEVLSKSMSAIGNCADCRDYTEKELCQICANDKRDPSIICVVESPSDIMAIESTATFSGRYFVLMGCLSPLDGMGPEEIGLDDLSRLVARLGTEELIIATPSTIEGEATAHFIKSLFTQGNDEQSTNVKISKLAQGVPIGGELGYLDQSTLSLSLANRQSI